MRKNVKKARDFTISVGVSHYQELAGNINELITNADKALYKAQRAGKDKVSLYKKMFNSHVIYKWNRSENSALSAGILFDRIGEL